MLKTFFQFTLSLLAVLSFSAGPALAAKPSGGGGKPTTEVNTTTGIDISFPQCGSRNLPKGQAFVIVGVNGGTASKPNTCLAEQLSWANANATDLNANQPKLQLYVNTANPYDDIEAYNVTTWPKDNIDPLKYDTRTNNTNPHGECTPDPGAFGGYRNDLACSWQYGWNRAVETVNNYFIPAAKEAQLSSFTPASYKWWLDVETMNSWQTKHVDAKKFNTASLEGMMAYYKSIGVAKVGIYSTSLQWNEIAGTTVTEAGSTVGGNLKGVESWMAGAGTAANAERRCEGYATKGLTGGPAILNQYISKNLDYNFSCI